MINLFKKLCLLICLTTLISTIYARVVIDRFDGLSHGKIWELSNGKIVKQKSYKTRSGGNKQRAEVELYKSGGKWMLLIKHINETIEVELKN